MPEDDGILFQEKDSRGRLVICTHSTWNHHIVSKRPAMNSDHSKEEVRKTIADPDFGIYQDVELSSRQCYYRLCRNRPVMYMKVVVEFNGQPNRGHVVTAFLCDNMKSGEKLL